MDTDRNLLFAVLALQADLLDRDRFVQACSLWAARKDTPIADLLVAQGWLTPAHRAVVDQLLEAKLHKHGGDAHKSLAEVRGALAAAADADVQRSLAALADAPGRRDGLAAEDFSTVPPSNTAGRNILYEEIGRGGMGRVLRGRDPELRRDLAVKVLAEEYRDNPGVARRFIEEAQVGGQLQHPGTVPVYELGRLGDGGPFFTMKLVKGRTLGDLLKERPSPRHDLARFLTIFEAVCQTIAYAHSKAVIHRDLKPSNVMVGSFGEVQVMDWGLAKVLQGPPADEPDATAPGTLIRTARTDSTAEEDGRTGVVGTPAFMAPEQARGEVEAVDERADVFGLGAVLCMILTGQPPYTGAGRDEVLAKAAAGDLAEAFARLDGCGADAELVALCGACLAPRRQERPRDAGKVAARVAAYQAAVRERLRQAELERAAAQARADEARATAAAERKARRRTRALAAAVLALVAVVAGGGLFVQHQAAEQTRRDAEQRHMVESALDKAVELRQQARWREAQAVLGQARQGLGDTVPGDLRQRLDTAEAELALVDGLDAIRQRRATLVEGGFNDRATERDCAAAFREAGLGEMGDDVEAVAARVAASGVAGPLVAALDDWASRAEDENVKSWLLGVARRADPDQWRDRFRDPDMWRDRRALQALAEEALRDDGAKLDELSPQVLTSLARRLGGDAETVRLLRAAQRRHPNDFWLSFALGIKLQHGQQAEEAVGYLRVAVALRPDTSAAHDALGMALVAKQDVDGAIAEFRKAIDLNPEFAPAHNHIGFALHDQHRDREAEAAYREAIRLQPDFPEAHWNLGLALYRRKDVDGAIAEFRKVIALDPKDFEAHNQLGVALSAQGRHKEAEAAYREALRLKHDYPEVHYNLGLALDRQHRYREAEMAYREAIHLKPDDPKAYYNLGIAQEGQGHYREAEATYREAIRLKPDYPEAHNGLGEALRHQGRDKEAEAAYREAIRLQPDYPEAHWNLGQALSAQSRHKEAEAAYREAIRLKPDYPEAYINLGAILNDSQGRFKDAEAAFREAIRLKPDFAEAHFNLGNALASQGRYKEAEAANREAIRLKPEFSMAHCTLGFALRGQGRFGEALEEMRRGHTLGSKTPGWSAPSADWVRQCERLIELDRKLPAVLKGDAEPASAVECLAFASLCQHPARRLPAAAAHLAADAFAADPKLADDLRAPHRYNAACSAALAAAGPAEDARLMPDKVIVMLRRQALAWLRADLALYAKLAERDDARAKQAVRQRLTHWQQDSDLASVRDKEALARLPDDERQAWGQLWDDVAALLKKVEQKP